MIDRPQTRLVASFGDVKLFPEYHDGRIWLPSSQLAKALGYSTTKAFNVQARRLAGSIAPVKLRVWTDGGEQVMAAFSPRDCMEIARRSRAPNRLEFFNWIDSGGLLLVETDRV